MQPLDYLSGEHDCGDLKNSLNRSVSFSDASTYLKVCFIY